MPTTTKLHQINAVLNGYKPQAERRFTDLHQLSAKTTLWSGQQRTFQPYDDDDRGEPAKSELVQVKAPQVLADVSAALGKLFDLQLTQDTTNAVAAADVVVNGETLIENAPVTYLLFLDKQLVLLRKYIDSLPTLDPADHWTYDNDREVSVSDPVKTISTRKVLKVLELAPATDKHAAQTKPYETDEPRGEWTTIKMSGALPAATVRQYRERLDALLEAVKVAKEAANDIGVTDRKAGDKVFSYLFG